MATATKSTLNSKLPGVDKICFCTSAGKNMCQKLYTGENGKFSMKVGYRQKSKSYPFQIQYRVRSRYTQANAKKKGADWTAWTVWKNAVAVSGIAKDATETAKPVNEWMKANKGVNQNGTYATFYTFSGYQIPAGFDARQFQFRIRTFNKAQAKHGNWCHQILSVYKRAAIVDEQGITAPDGGFRVKFNYIWDRAISMNVSSVVDESGRELLQESFTTTLQTVKLTSSTIPASRNGYTGGQVTIPLANLKRKIEDGEHLTCTINAVTGDGASTKLDFSEIVDLTATIPLTMSTSWDEARGILTVSVVNDNEIELEELGCSCSYTYNGNRYSVPAVFKGKQGTNRTVFDFYSPIGIPLKIEARAEDKYNRIGTQVLNDFTVNASGYRLNHVKEKTICGVGWGEASFTVKSTPQYETALPYGRMKSIIFYGKGNTTTITLKAKIVDKANLYGGQYARKSGWDKVKGKQGVYYFRSNKGDMYKVGITGMNISKKERDMYELTVDMVEVV